MNDKVEFIVSEFNKYVESLSDHYEVNYKFEKTSCEISFKKEYSGIEEMVSFDTILFLSKLLGTSKINIDNEDFVGGCETCDWGSRHSAVFICKDIKI